MASFSMVRLLEKKNMKIVVTLKLL